jgi:peroxiredoxin
MGVLRQLKLWIGTEGHMTNIVTGITAPDFSLRALDGKEFALGKLLEHGPVVAAFFKISCPVCQFTFPFLERLHQRYGLGRATILGISQDDARATKEFATEFGITFTMLLDEKQKGYLASNAYGLTSVPVIILIGTDGAAKVVCQGFDKKGLESIAAELSERSKIAPAALFRPDESVPAYKPG